ncbi:MAG: hypothetical protein AAFV93_15105 [Chloroflexota bacterium]
MRRGRPLKPIISIESVKSALKSLDSSAQSEQLLQPLENLVLVDTHLQKEGHINAEDIRGWVLRQILVDTITEQLNYLRGVFRLQDVRVDAPIDVETNYYLQSIRMNSDLLKGWHLLYLRYVRPELALSMQQLSDTLKIVICFDINRCIHTNIL